MKAKYSKPFQTLITKCKTVKWIITPIGAIRLASDYITCPMSFAVGKEGICGDYAAKKLGFRDPTANFYTIAHAADGFPKTALEKEVYTALYRELVERV